MASQTKNGKSLKGKVPSDGSDYCPVAVVLGWFLNEVSATLRLAREDRRVAGLVLNDLLEVSHRLRALDSTIGELKKYFPLSLETEMTLKQALDLIVPEAPHFADRYEEAVSIIARSDPLLPFRLGNQPMMGRLMAWLRGLAASDQTASIFWTSVGEPGLLKLFNPHLEELIRDVARVHGWRTRWRTGRTLKKPLEFTKEEHEWVSSLLSVAQSQLPTAKPTDPEAEEGTANRPDAER
jgi:hypothetical protein